MANKNQIQQWLRWGAWIAVVAVIIFFLTKNEENSSNDNISTEQSQNLATTEQNTTQTPIPEYNYETVMMPRGLSNTVVKYKGFTVNFNKNLHIPNCVV